MAFDARTIRAYIADIRNGELKRAHKAAPWVPRGPAIHAKIPWNLVPAKLGAAYSGCSIRVLRPFWLAFVFLGMVPLGVVPLGVVPANHSAQIPPFESEEPHPHSLERVDGA